MEEYSAVVPCCIFKFLYLITKENKPIIIIIIIINMYGIALFCNYTCGGGCGVVNMVQ